ncbi:sideroflexin-2 isoform X2 [Ctenocephalides felis]|uniref:sideroflexin-2 isoform X2 n=1 Tax=Ctenocephalides felis TaxID=7515 RepID=UPI000E6E1ED2|nr:sideroflexin-2 isoform X2 [Ctenocephalides felis]
MSDSMSLHSTSAKLIVENPLWEQNTFVGRFRHFLWMTDWRSCFASERDLDKAEELIKKCKRGEGCGDATRCDLIYAKKLYESAFHPDTGEKQNLFGRMSFQVPGGMAITGAMLQFYRTNTAVVFWQWVNQSFNALVNYTNRNANSPVSTVQLGVAYVTATTSALITALGCKSYWQKNASPFMQRYVPFAAVAAANCVNIPMMRQTELLAGIDVVDSEGRIIGKSRLAAAKGISQVVLSRIVMAAPGMLVLPIIMERLEKFDWMRRLKILHAPMQVMMVGCFLTVMVPTACALFPQQCSLKISTIERFEPEFYADMKSNNDKLPELVYFNKGL